MRMSTSLLALSRRAETSKGLEMPGSGCKTIACSAVWSGRVEGTIKAHQEDSGTRRFKRSRTGAQGQGSRCQSQRSLPASAKRLVKLHQALVLAASGLGESKLGGKE